MKSALPLVALLLALCGCSGRRDFGPLVNGYVVMAASPRELYVMRPDSTIVAGPGIEQIGIVGDVLVLKCGRVDSPAGPGCQGYRIIRTRDGSLYEADDAQRVAERLAHWKMSPPPLQPAWTFLAQ